MLTILSVAYPLARVGIDAVAAIAKAGHHSMVVASEGSKVTGELIPVSLTRGPLDEANIAAARTRHRWAISQALRHRRVDLVHMHGFDFDAYLPPEGVPVLATLHCPADWYSAAALRPSRPRTYLNGVSARQHAMLGRNPRLLEPIENGVPVGAFSGSHRKRSFALMLARIAPEKGVHVALRAAKAAGLPLLVAGELFPYPGHGRYLVHDVEPLLDHHRRWIGPVGFARKRRLLAAARCLLVCSQVPETSSLVAREAMAAGTPVVALRRGALADVVDDGRTGFLVDDERALPDALRSVDALDPEVCRRTARERFDAGVMTRSYLRLYERLVRSEASAVLDEAGAA